MAADLSFYLNKQHEGFGRNLTRNEDVHLEDQIGLRASLLLTPGSGTRIRISGGYFYNGGDYANTRHVLPGSYLRVGYGFTGRLRDTLANAPLDTQTKQYGMSARIEQDLGFPILSSISAYRRSDTDTLFDQDAGPLRFIDARFNSPVRSFQQELLLVGSVGRLDWTAGLFYFHSIAKNEPLALMSDFFLTNNVERFAEQKTDSYAAFAQGTYEIFDGMRFTAGARYTVDKRSIDGSDVAATGNSAAPPGTVLRSVSDEETFKKLTWRLALDQRITANVLVYGSLSRGFKSGIYNLANPFQPAVNPETLDDYEIGIKSDVFDRLLRINASGFIYKYDNIQLQSSQSGVTQLLNAAKATIRGAELEAVLSPSVKSGRLTFSGSLSILGSNYDVFLNAPSFVPNPAPPACPLGSPSCGGNRTIFIDASGNEIIRAPDWTSTLSANYVHRLGDGSNLGFYAGWSHNDGYYVEPDNRIKVTSYDVVNAEVSFTTADDRWQVRMFMNNVFTEDYLNAVSSGADGDRVSWGAPRRYGLALRMQL